MKKKIDRPTPVPQKVNAWAICKDDVGLMVFTVRQTRKEAIHAFMEVVVGKDKRNLWRNLWRKYRGEGWRASHVAIDEMLFTEDTQS